MIQDMKDTTLKPIKTLSVPEVPIENIVTAVDQRAAQLSQLAEQSDLRGLEEALATPSPAPKLKSLDEKATIRFNKHVDIPGDQNNLTDEPDKAHAEGAPSSLKRVDTPPDPRRALVRDFRAPEWQALTVTEKDIVIVMMAMCKVFD